MILDASVAAVAVTLAIALGAATEAGAQTIYRCGNGYSVVGCANAAALDRVEPSSAIERSEARQSIADLVRAANEMEQNRLRNEAMIRPALAGSLGPARIPHTATSAAAKKPTRRKSNRFQTLDDPDFIAAVPGSGRRK